MEAAVLSYVAIGISVAAAILGAINHKRLRSNCCGKETVLSVDVENTTPPSKAVAEVEPAPPPPIKLHAGSTAATVDGCSRS